MVDSLDYECELGVIIGRDARNVPREDVSDYIFGYTIVNDVSARNLQTRHKQWYFGKSLDGFTPMGPCIVTADEFSFPPELGISCLVNGEVRQDSSTRNLIAGIPEIISMLSEGMTLQAGTIIATGTPAGVGMGMTPPTFLNEGDVVECRIEGIGSLRNVVC
jgi:2-keto-4-pentenoate hydratase/2-oxohepta-3-ene-1,7-dioic acid hydratase in catechol pathway